MALPSPGSRLTRRTLLAAAFAVAGHGARAEDSAPENSAPENSGLVELAPGVSAYRAQPGGAGPFPIVLVGEDGTGIGGFAAELCRRLAAAGYLAIAPELFAAGDGADEVTFRRFDAAADWAAQHGGDPRRLVATGFGRGGRAVWLYDADSMKLRAAVVWEAPLHGATAPERPRAPAEVAGKLRAPLLGLYGKAGGVTSAALLAIEGEAKRGGRTAEMVLYDGAGPDFATPGGPGFRDYAAQDAWTRMLAWFRRHGAG